MESLQSIPKMSNTTFTSDLPPLPSYTLKPQGSLLPFISDFFLSLLLPVAAYWVLSGIFHVIDTLDLFPQYRLHTPAEILKRNHATRLEVLRDVIIQHIIQVAVGIGLGWMEPEQMTGKDDYNVAIWAQRIRIAQRALPQVLGVVGLNASAISKNVALSYPLLAGAISGGHYPWLTDIDLTTGSTVLAFANWELLLAKFVYWVAVPSMQFMIGIVVQDAWQYWIHRAMHLNKWLYTTVHARHHRLYVPYAYGALYNHPLEALLLDTLGASIAYKVAFMSPRLGIAFFTACTIKTVDDHSGYSLPWDPVQHITSNNAAYHDIHHQSWGIKTNFSQPFFTFWDKWLGTMWQGETKLRYERSAKAAQLLVDADHVDPKKSQ